MDMSQGRMTMQSGLTVKIISNTMGPCESFAVGLALYKSADYYSAFSEFLSMADQGKLFPEIYINIGCCLLSMGQVEESISWYTKALKTASLIETCSYNIAIAYMYEHDYTNAMKAINFYTGGQTKDYIALKRFIYSKNSSNFPYVLKKIREEQVLNKKISGASTKSTVCIKKTMESARLPITNVKSFDSRKFRTKNVTPDIKKQEFFRKKKKSKQHSFCQSVKKKISEVPSIPDIYYGKGLNKIRHKTEFKIGNQVEKMQFVQESIGNPNKNNENSTLHKIFQSKTRSFYENQGKDIQNSYFYNPKNLEAHYITKKEVSNIFLEYSKPIDQRNYLCIDSITIKNAFFSRFSLETRISLLKLSKPLEFLSNFTIFHEGDYGEDMYAIIRGSVTLEKASELCKNESIIIASLYDGRYFGELPLGSNALTRDFRTSSCKTTENTFVFALNKHKYNEIILEQLEHDLEKKITLLSQVEVFKNIDPFDLIPMATHVKAVYFKSNQMILEKNSRPEGLFIIVKGFAKAITEGIRIKKISEVDSTKKFRKHPTRNISSERNINDCIMTANSETWKGLVQVVSEEEKKLIGQDKYFEKDRIEYSVLHEKDFFGGRAILGYEKSLEISPSKFSIVIKT